MVSQRWYPFTDIKRDVFGRSWGRSRVFSAYDRTNEKRWGIPLDVSKTEDSFIVEASLPGLEPEEIDVTLEDLLLTISAKTKTESEVAESEYLLKERRIGKFRRTLRLPRSVDADKARLSYANGVLTITLPHKEEEKTRRLQIESP